MTANPHLSAEELSAFLDDELSDAARSRAESHLIGCEICRDELAEVRGVVSLLQSLPQYEPPHSFTLEAHHVAASRSSAGSLSHVLPAVRTLSVAAVMGLFVVTSIAIFSWVSDRGHPLDEAVMSSETTAPPGASKKATGSSDGGSGGLIERGDTAASHSVPPPAPSVGGTALAAARHDVARRSASPGAAAAEPAVTDTAAVADDGSSWLMTGIGLGALAIVLVGLWLVIVRMGRAYRRPA